MPNGPDMDFRYDANLGSGDAHNSVDFWDLHLNQISDGIVGDIADKSYQGGQTAEFEDEEFRDASEVLQNHSLQDPDADLEGSGIHTSLKARRTASMSSNSSESISADSYFLRRSQDGLGDLDLFSAEKVFLQNVQGQPEKAEYVDSDSRRSTLTKKDFEQSNRQFPPISLLEENRVMKSRPSSSSTSSSRRSSISTHAALEELDRIVAEFSSDDENERVSFGKVRRSTLLVKQSMRSSATDASAKEILKDIENSVVRNLSHRFSADEVEYHPTTFKMVPAGVRLTESNPTVTPSFDRSRKPHVLNTVAMERRKEVLIDKVRKHDNTAETFPPFKQDTAIKTLHSETVMQKADAILARLRQKQTESRNEQPESTRNGNRPVDISKTKRTELILDRDLNDDFRHIREHHNLLNNIRPQRILVSETSADKSIQTDNFSSGAHLGESLLEQSVYPIGSSTETRDIVLAAHQIFFPPTEVGESSSAKLQIKNYTAVTYQLTFSTINPPFQKRYDTLNVQPRRYVNIPLRFFPRTTGYFQTEMSVGAEYTGKLYKVHLVGEGIPKLHA